MPNRWDVPLQERQRQRQRDRAIERGENAHDAYANQARLMAEEVDRVILDRARSGRFRIGETLAVARYEPLRMSDLLSNTAVMSSTVEVEHVTLTRERLMDAIRRVSEVMDRNAIPERPRTMHWADEAYDWAVHQPPSWLRYDQVAPQGWTRIEADTEPAKLTGPEYINLLDDPKDRA